MNQDITKLTHKLLVTLLLPTPIFGGGMSESIAELKAPLEERGVFIGGEYLAEYSDVINGGINEDDSFRNLFTLDVEVDLGKALHLEGGTFFAQYLHVDTEKGGTADSGDLQVFSNIENDQTLDVIYELWYEQLLLEDRLRLKIGKVDANSEFNYVDAAGNFANSSAGFSPNIFVFPSYPDSAMSVNLFATLVDSENASLTLGYGLYDGAAGADGISLGNRGPSSFFKDDLSDDYFHIVEASLDWQSLSNMGGGRASVGIWHHTGEFTRIDGSLDEGTQGFNLTLEQQVFTFGTAGQRSVSLFAQYGKSDEDVNEVEQHFGFGLATDGALRDADSFGIYFTYVALSAEAGFSKDEWVVDIYYRIQIYNNFFVQPELQYIKNPSGSTSVTDATVGIIRAGFSF